MKRKLPDTPPTPFKPTQECGHWIGLSYCVPTGAGVKVLDKGFIELVTQTGHLSMVVDAARCSYGSDGDSMGERDQKLVRFLLQNGHTSPFRHYFFTFHIKAPLFVFRQWWKYQVGSTWREYETPQGEPLSTCHTSFKGPNNSVVQPVVASDIQTDTDQGCSWNELSGRYKVMEPEFYVPEKARKNTGKQASEDTDDSELTNTLQKCMTSFNHNATALYESLLQDGVAKELARLVLPPSIYSEAYWTVSLQAVLHFLDQRLKPEAQYEIRQYAQAMLELIKPTLEKMGIST